MRQLVAGKHPSDDMASEGREPKPGAYTRALQLEAPARSTEPGKRTLTEALVPQAVSERAPASGVQMRSGSATHDDNADDCRHHS